MALGHLDELQKAEKYPIRWSLYAGFTVDRSHIQCITGKEMKLSTFLWNIFSLHRTCIRWIKGLRRKTNNSIFPCYRIIEVISLPYHSDNLSINVIIFALTTFSSVAHVLSQRTYDVMITSLLRHSDVATGLGFWCYNDVIFASCIRREFRPSFRICYRGISSFATDFSCGIWCPCVLCVDPIFIRLVLNDTSSVSWANWELICVIVL